MATGNRTFDFVFYATNSVAYSCLYNIRTDIGRAQSDLFSSRVETFSRESAAFRLIVSSFFTNFFIMTGGRKSLQVFAGSNPNFRRTRQPAGGSPFLRHLSLFFLGNSFSRSGRGNPTPSLSVRSSHCKHGMSVRMNQFVLIFSGAFFRLAHTTFGTCIPLFPFQNFTSLRGDGCSGRRIDFLDNAVCAFLNTVPHFYGSTSIFS